MTRTPAAYACNSSSRTPAGVILCDARGALRVMLRDPELTAGALVEIQTAVKTLEAVIEREHERARKKRRRKRPVNQAALPAAEGSLIAAALDHRRLHEDAGCRLCRAAAWYMTQLRASCGGTEKDVAAVGRKGFFRGVKSDALIALVSAASAGRVRPKRSSRAGRAPGEHDGRAKPLARPRLRGGSPRPAASPPARCDPGPLA